jgi:hypothetical protein
MATFHLCVDTENDHDLSPGDVMFLLRKVIHDLGEGRTEGDIRQFNKKKEEISIGEWCLDLSPNKDQ